MAKSLDQISRRATMILLLALASFISARTMSGRVASGIKGAYGVLKSAANSFKSNIWGKMRGSLWAIVPASLSAYYVSSRPETISDAYDRLCQLKLDGGVEEDARNIALLIRKIEMRKFILYRPPDIEKNVIDSAVHRHLQREREHASAYHVFYHGQCQDIRMLSDIYTYLLEWEQQQHYSGFAALRFVPDSPTNTPSPLIHARVLGLYATESVPRTDYEPDAFRSLVSANFAFNGNHLNYGENSFRYFLSDFNINKKKIIRSNEIAHICKFYGLNPVHMGSIKTLNNSAGSLLQIFIPKDQLNKACYVALSGGRAYGDKWVSAANTTAEDLKLENRHRRACPLYEPNNIVRDPKITGVFPLFDENETNSEVLQGGPLEYFCRTNKNFAPWITPSRFLAALKWGLLPREVAQAAQMRLVMGQDIMLNPKVTKIYREDLAPPQAIDEYSRQFKSCMHRAVLDWLDCAEKGSLPQEVIERIKGKPVYQLVVNAEKREQERSRLKKELAELDAQDTILWWQKLNRWFV